MIGQQNVPPVAPDLRQWVLESLPGHKLKFRLDQNLSTNFDPPLVYLVTPEMETAFEQLVNPVLIEFDRDDPAARLGIKPASSENDRSGFIVTSHNTDQPIARILDTNNRNIYLKSIEDVQMRFSERDWFLHHPSTRHTNLASECIPISGLELNPAFSHVIYNIENHADRYLILQANDDIYLTEQEIRTVVTETLGCSSDTGNAQDQESCTDVDLLQQGIKTCLVRVLECCPNASAEQKWITRAGHEYAVTVTAHDAKMEVKLIGLAGVGIEISNSRRIHDFGR